jgi:exodeoxyribonuclease VII small subunit
MTDYTYSQAMERLEAILSQLEEGTTSVDTLTELVQEAAALVNQCRANLRSTEEAVQGAFEGV